MKPIKPIKNFFSACLNSKRRGSGLILALMVALVGGAVGALIFDVAGSYLRTTSLQSRVYTDDIIAVEHIERAKAAVITENRARYKIGEPVLRSKANEDYNDFIGQGEINNTDKLMIGDKKIYPNETKGTVARNVEVEVWDAMYNPDRLQLPGGVTAVSNIPPSFFIESGPPGDFTGENFDEQIQYAEGGGSQSGSLGGFKDIHDKFGVYLIRVKIHQIDGAKNLIRTTEEAFANLISGDT